MGEQGTRAQRAVSKTTVSLWRLKKSLVSTAESGVCWLPPQACKGPCPPHKGPCPALLQVVYS